MAKATMTVQIDTTELNRHLAQLIHMATPGHRWKLIDPLEKIPKYKTPRKIKNFLVLIFGAAIGCAIVLSCM